jgi:uncharacterized membrane protein
MVGLGDLPGGTFDSFAFSVSGDGQRIVGYGKTETGAKAFIWDQIQGMRDLQTVLETEGLAAPLAGWTLLEARAISDDGSTIVGYGRNPDGQFEAWRAQLTPVPVPAAVWLFGSGLAGLIGLARRRMTS